MTSMGFSYCLFSFLKEDYPFFVIVLLFELFSDHFHICNEKCGRYPNVVLTEKYFNPIHD
jgi:hypothetical protein